MAAYTELHALAGQNTILDRTQRAAWAKTAFENPQQQAKNFQNAVLAANNTLTVTNITNATDSALQTAVDAAVNIFAGV